MKPLDTLNPCEISSSDLVRSYVRQSVSENTRRAYRADLKHFTAWGGIIPASDVMVAEYLVEHAGELSIATLTRRLASISKTHAAKGLLSPTKSELVKSTMRGIKRAHAAPQRAAQPLLVEDLMRIMAMLGDDVKDVRDRALLLTGFAGGFRRSELVGLNVDDLEWVRQGLVIHLRRSKTDQEGQGRKVGVPYARGRWCPVESLKAWITIAEIEGGPIFRPVTRHERIQDARLSAEAINGVVKERVGAIGMDPKQFSGHSLRAGLATSAAQAGVATWKIRQQTGHASDAMLARYIRDGELFTDNASSALL
ncbi:tyrosine-type recombinase/integrase [Magnetovibrio sp.]|uniref:tyrosine-type recombinase/integrase n=1 Tax=Magnetovibrio sp. TaxID=2024836 RepID=UPI002F927C55